ncbi:hypothetical protein JD844_015274 [Phrynosoma platyrhinos]|uniref:ATP-dependent RNA helicase n=1 Tax=Phrynosoma platyrhinos TaxID=52577 RepID=A0ABQ7T7H0_PHRPL|nr:hypothetical protein JD844_015274 [Phrynosoma platyrhinos]
MQLISTDATARGIDVAGVKCVISYDAPQFIRTYVHRVGRTARAGRAGLAFTLLLKQQESKFLRMLREAGLPPLERQLVRSGQIRTLLPGYEEALAALQETVKGWREVIRTRLLRMEEDFVGLLEELLPDGILHTLAPGGHLGTGFKNVVSGSDDLRRERKG